MKNIIKLIIAGICFLPLLAVAEEVLSETEILLDTIKYNRSHNTAEIQMKIYNRDYEPGVDNMYYSTYYLKMYCGQRTYKPLITEGYTQDNKLLLVDYSKYQPQQIVEGSDIEQAYNYACQHYSIPKVNKRSK